jgi:hypothetical protein
MKLVKTKNMQLSAISKNNKKIKSSQIDVSSKCLVGKKLRDRTFLILDNIKIAVVVKQSVLN